MEIESDVKNNVCTIILTGELDEQTSNYTREKIDKIIKNLPPLFMVVYDFSRVVFMDSTGIGVLIGRYKKFSENRLVFNIKNPNKTIDKIMQMTGIYQIMPKMA